MMRPPYRGDETTSIAAMTLPVPAPGTNKHIEHTNVKCIFELCEVLLLPANDSQKPTPTHANARGAGWNPLATNCESIRCGRSACNAYRPAGSIS